MRTVHRSTDTLRRVGWRGALAAALACSTWSVLAQNPAPAAESGPLPETVRFNRDIRPILSDRCYTCHGPDSGTRRAGLRLDDPDSVRQAATRTTPAQGPLAVIAPGDPDRSALLHRVTATDPARRMPFREEPLEPREVALISRWIEQGARYEPHWSFIPPVRPDLPVVRSADWPRNPSTRSSSTGWSRRDCGRPRRPTGRPCCAG